MSKKIGEMIKEINDIVEMQRGIGIGFFRDENGVFHAYNRDNRLILFDDSELPLLEKFRNWCGTLPNDDYGMVIAPF